MTHLYNLETLVSNGLSSEARDASVPEGGQELLDVGMSHELSVKGREHTVRNQELIKEENYERLSAVRYHQMLV